MKASELLSGSYYIAPCGEISMWDSDSFSHYRSVGVLVKNLKAIPISIPELKKLGFSKYGDEYYKRINKKRLQLCVTEWGMVHLARKEDLTATMKFPNVKYIHQLQGLYLFMSGTQLKYKK